MFVWPTASSIILTCGLHQAPNREALQGVARFNVKVHTKDDSRFTADRHFNLETWSRNAWRLWNSHAVCCVWLTVEELHVLVALCRAPYCNSAKLAASHGEDPSARDTNNPIFLAL